MSIESAIAAEVASEAVKVNPWLAVGKAIVSVLGGVRACIWLAFALWFAWSAHSWKGRAGELQAEKAKAVAAQVVAAAKLAEAQANVTVRVVTKYVDRVQVIRGRTQTIVKEVPVYVPSDAPALPGGFRVLHDAAALGVIPDPARIADAAPVAAQDVAATVADNYGTCQANAEQVSALQDWIRQQQALK